MFDRKRTPPPVDRVSGPSTTGSGSDRVSDRSVEPNPNHQTVVSGWRPGDPANEVARRPGDRVPNHIRAELLGQVQQSPSMLEILREIGTTDIPMFWSDRGSYHRAGDIFLDLDEDDLLGTLMHELEHLRTYETGEGGNVRRMSREDYVASKLAEETRAHAQTYVGLMELGIERDRDTAGFDAFRNYLRRTAPELLQRDQNPGVAAVQSDLILQHATAWVHANFQNNDAWKTSNTGENYGDYYGSFWDQVHSR